MTDIPVLIVGGGPVGLALAVELGWRGIPCNLIEQGDGSIRTPKMNEVNIRTMEFCRRWGIDDQVMNCPFPADHPMDVAVVTKLGGYELGRIERPARRDQPANPFSPANLQVCSQTWFDPILRQKAQSLPGVTMLYGHRLESFDASDAGVMAEVTNRNTGDILTLSARYMAACDGAGSRVRRALGVELIGGGVLSHSVNLFMRTPDLLGQLGVDRGTFFAAVDKDGFWGNVRLIDPENGLWRILFDVPEGVELDEIDKDAALRRAVAKPVEAEWVDATLWTRRGVVAERYADPPVFLVGDAVHQVSPTGALGMNTGIGDAVDLGWKLAAVIDGWADGALLDSYNAERQPVGARNVAMATKLYEGQLRFVDGVEAIEDDTPDGQALRDRVGPEVLGHIQRVFRTIGLQIGYRYAGSPICVDDGTVPPEDDPETYTPSSWPGARAPHARLGGERSTLDLFGRGFTLLRLGYGAPDGGALKAAATAAGVPLETVSIEDAAVARLYESPLVLVRPDGHVAWRGDVAPDDANAIIATITGRG